MTRPLYTWPAEGPVGESIMDDIATLTEMMWKRGESEELIDAAIQYYLGQLHERHPTVVQQVKRKEDMN